MQIKPQFLACLIGYSALSCVLADSRSPSQDPPAKSDQGELEYLLDNAATLMCQTNYQEALKVSLSTETKYPLDPLLWYQRSCILEHLGDREGAIAAANKTIPIQSNGYLFTMRLYERLDDSSNAFRMVDDAMADPRIKFNRELQARIFNQKATILLHKEKSVAALDASDRAFQLLPGNKHILRVQLLKTRMEILKKLHRTKEADACHVEAANLEQQVGMPPSN